MIKPGYIFVFAMLGVVTSKVMSLGVISAKLSGEEKKSQAVSKLTGISCVNSILYVFNFLAFKLNSGGRILL